MKIKKTSFLIVVVIIVLGISACGKEPENTRGTASKPEKKEVEDVAVTNKDNVKSVVDAVSDPEVRYKVAIDDEMHIFAISDNFRIFSGNDEDNSYGFSDPYNIGTSVYAYASEKGLNEEQTATIIKLLSDSAVDEQGKKIKDIAEYYPEDFTENKYPYQGTDIDYMTLSNIETEPSEKGEKITADVTVHLHLVDGTEESKTFKSSAEPEIGDTPLDEERVNKALSADVMNEEIPTEDRFIYVDKPEGK